MEGSTFKMEIHAEDISLGRSIVVALKRSNRVGK
jgi:hypothetical protein